MWHGSGSSTGAVLGTPRGPASSDTKAAVPDTTRSGRTLEGTGTALGGFEALEGRAIGDREGIGRAAARGGLPHKGGVPIPEIER